MTGTAGKNNSIWNRQSVFLLTAVFCGCLWGSAHPCVKVGYRLFQVGADDVASQILFAGVRFTLAGILVIVFGSMLQRKLLVPTGKDLPHIVSLAAWQTVIQYFFFYVGLAHAAAIRSSILNGTQTFITILLAVFLFRYEKLTLRKVCGCILGFAGVVLIETLGQPVEFGFVWNGEGFILMTCFAASMASCLIKKYGQTSDPVLLSGYQFTLGGLVLTAASLAAGGRLVVTEPSSLLLILYMAFISSAAYTLWGLLLKHNPVSKVSMFTFVTPAAGVIISSIVLDEGRIFNLYTLLSLLLICIGIMIVFWNKKTGPDHRPAE